MTDHYRIVKASELTVENWQEAQRLLAAGNRLEGLDLSIDLEPLVSVSGEIAQYFYYEQGVLLALASLQEGLEVELSGLVHPERRRRGIGRRFLQEIQAEYRQRGHDYLLLVCDEASASGRAFVTAVGAQYRSAEYRLALDPPTIDRSRPRPEGFQLRPAGAGEASLLVYLQATSFGDPEEETKSHVAQGLRQPNRQYLIGWLGTEPVGLLRLGRYGQVADITAFGVLPAYRGRGYGRQMLLDAIDLFLAEDWPQILIEVATDNQNALGLYQSCGFRITRTYGFYKVLC